MILLIPRRITQLIARRLFGIKFNKRIFIFLVISLSFICAVEVLILFKALSVPILKTVSIKTDLSTVSQINKDIDVKEVYKSLDFHCKRDDRLCIAHFLEEFTADYGPKNALDILTLLGEDNKLSPAIDKHYLAHLIGESVAKAFGADGEAFLACPMEAYNGGCTHGYFEYFTAESGSAQKAALRVCDSLSRNLYSYKYLVYCYHGIGHGILMSNGYDLYSALNTCDRLSFKEANEGCWQGVFMENVMGHQRGVENEGFFSETDIFSPCNKLDKKYSSQCYLNHSGYLLVNVYEGSVEKAAQGCTTSPDHAELCARGLGPFITSPSWIYQKTGAVTTDDAVLEASKICDAFPTSIIAGCFKGSMGNILNEDWPDIKRRALKLCEATEEWPRTKCYEFLGVYMKYLVPEDEDLKHFCNLAPPEFRQNCYDGAKKGE